MATPLAESPTAAESAAGSPEASTDRQLTVLSSLLENLEEVAHSPVSPHAKSDMAHQNHLVRKRLGIASGLFAALRARHAPTAAHCLRVAISCSSWAVHLKLEEKQRDELEMAALLHDLGKIGVSDHVLFKPGKLNAEEAMVMDRHRGICQEILGCCCASQEILETIYYSSAWYDGRRHGFDKKGEELPVGSRVLAIADAYDSMTTNHVYRKAFSRERAVNELLDKAGEQFDLKLVKSFCEMLTQGAAGQHVEVARRWLQDLQDESAEGYWTLSQSQAATATVSAPSTQVDQLFHRQLMDSLDSGAIFLDSQLTVVEWNQAAQRLTGVSPGAVCGKAWKPELIQLRDENYKLIASSKCPVSEAVRSGETAMKRLIITNGSNEKISVNMQISPVKSVEGVVYGAALLIHDISQEVNLEARVESLHEKATQDPLTQLANRAEFDRSLKEFIVNHLDRGKTCSLIICDLDFFKKINDNYGHQAGDDALICTAGLLKSLCRSGDLVARYGGEEFVMLCADCNNKTATQRAESIRIAISEKPQPTLGGRRLTASFGVTELQAGDTPETMLRRADRALLQAKDDGRNTVVHIGSGMQESENKKSRSGWFSWFQESPSSQLLERRLLMPVSMKLAAEKLRGFISDHSAEIMTINENNVTMRINATGAGANKTNDKGIPLIVELMFEELYMATEQRTGNKELRTIVHVKVRSRRQRDRRRKETVERARELLMSVKSYLMAQDFSDYLGA